jgi:hypothetical protein
VHRRNYLRQLKTGAFCAGPEIVSKLSAVLQVEPTELLKQPSTKYQRGDAIDAIELSCS